MNNVTNCVLLSTFVCLKRKATELSQLESETFTNEEKENNYVNFSPSL